MFADMVSLSNIPVTVLSGFLGAGKTTLLNRILTENHGVRFAVIVNEFGKEGIDNDLIINADEEVFEMNNGCVCCSIRGDLIRTLNSLMERSDKLDAVVIETTGLADPGPIAQIFFSDQKFTHYTKLDSIVAVVDAYHFNMQLSEHHETREQIAFADVILVNKIDLVDSTTLETVISDIKRTNPHAKLIKTVHCQAPINDLIDIDSFNLERVLEIKPQVELPKKKNKHDDQIGSVSLVSNKPLDIDKFQTWFGSLLESKGHDILRSKGIIEFYGLDDRYVFQGVHMLMDASPMGAWPDDCERISRIVFIGRNLESMGLKEGFESCQSD